MAVLNVETSRGRVQSRRPALKEGQEVATRFAVSRAWGSGFGLGMRTIKEITTSSDSVVVSKDLVNRDTTVLDSKEKKFVREELNTDEGRRATTSTHRRRPWRKTYSEWV